MKKLLTLLLYGALVFVLTGVCFGADSYTVTTNSLNSLDHSSAYSWEFNLGAAVGYNQTTEDISKIELTFKNISNYNNYANKLFLSVLDSPDGVRDWDNSAVLRHNTVDGYYDDNNDDWINYFVTTAQSKSNVGNVKQLLSISNLDTSANDIIITFDLLSNSVSITGVDDATEQNYKLTSYSLSNTAAADLSAWAQDGIFELGFDPDCHFSASGVSLKIYTTTTPSVQTGAVPEPETLVLFGFGLLGLSAFGRKRFSSMG